MDSYRDAQQDMKTAYYWGGPGVLISGLIWLISGLVAMVLTPFNGMVTLLVGGMLIFPLSMALCKLLGRSGMHQKQNPLAPLANQGTIWMLTTMLVAVALALYQQHLFYPAMLLIIGGRYLTFNTLYGLNQFYLLSVCLCGIAVAAAVLQPPIFAVALAGGAVEVLFAIVLVMQANKAQVVAS